MTAPAVVSFHGNKLLTVRDGETIRVAMKPITDAIGLQWEAQLKRIKRHPVLSQGVSMMDIPSNGGIQQHTTLPLELLNGWLFGIDANRVKPEIRDTLLMYQRECFKVLFEHFHPRRVESCTLTHQHQRDLQREVAKRVYASVSKENQRKAFPAIYRYLKDRFGVASYKDIPESKYTQALAAVESAPLEGVYIGHGEKPVHADGIWLDRIAVNRIHCLCCHFDAIHLIFWEYDIYGASKALGSPVGVKMIDHIKDGTSPSHHLQRLISGTSRYDQLRMT
ncbi:phage antirepressor N-terminal domain-containing protein [Carnimonas bestiolae]|uniref:phage antirepressor N-terminal domain-containing protein n=1 Tax=Carnimonas bestiolae TaxID=3402172 RepID=UPI003EDC0D46